MIKASAHTLKEIGMVQERDGGAVTTYITDEERDITFGLHYYKDRLTFSVLVRDDLFTVAKVDTLHKVVHINQDSEGVYA
jgi:hypothetical protein